MINDSGLIPVEFFVVVELDKQETVTKGGIILPPNASDREKLATQEGTLVAVSPVAFDYAEWPPSARKPKVGDRVLFKKYDGALHERNGKDYRLLNDKSIVAIIDQGDADAKTIPGTERPQTMGELLGGVTPVAKEYPRSWADVPHEKTGEPVTNLRASR